MLKMMGKKIFTILHSIILLILTCVHWCEDLSEPLLLAHVISIKVLCAALYTCLDKQKCQRKIVNVFWPIIFSICFGCSKELSH